MSTRRFDFPGPAGQTLSGRLERPDGPPLAWALFAHCFTCTKDSLAAARVSRALAARGIGVLRFDFTGLGDSEDEGSPGGFARDVADLLAAAKAMVAHDCAPSLLVGHSLGGAAALAAAGDLPGIAAVAVVGAPFDPALGVGAFGAPPGKAGEAIVNLGGRPFSLPPGFFKSLRAQAPGDRIAHLRRALLVLHSPQDPVIGIDNATAIFAAARHPKSFISLDRADHLLTRAQDADYAAEVIAAWASRYLPPPAPAIPDPATVGVVRVEETGAGRFQVRVHAGGAVFLADEPAAVGGMGSGPNPYDVLCAALGACTAGQRRGWRWRSPTPATRAWSRRTASSAASTSTAPWTLGNGRGCWRSPTAARCTRPWSTAPASRQQPPS